MVESGSCIGKRGTFAALIDQDHLMHSLLHLHHYFHRCVDAIFFHLQMRVLGSDIAHDIFIANEIAFSIPWHVLLHHVLQN